MNEDMLVDAVTKAIMDRLAADSTPVAAGIAGGGGAEVVVFGDVPAGILAPGVATRRGRTPSDVEGNQVIVMTIDAFRGFHGSAPLRAAAATRPACVGEIDMTGKRLLNERDMRASGAESGSTVRVCPKAILTALATDYAKSHAITIVRG